MQNTTGPAPAGSPPPQNSFAAAVTKGGRLVVLDPEVAAAFRESGAVNAVLRALLHTMPGRLPGETAEPRPGAAGGEGCLGV
jgi:hypothetical protein